MIWKTLIDIFHVRRPTRSAVFDRPLKSHNRKRAFVPFGVRSLCLAIICALGTVTFTIGLETAASAAVTGLTVSTDSLVAGDTGAHWTFSFTTSTDLASFDSMNITFPSTDSGGSGSGFDLSGVGVVSVTGCGTTPPPSAIGTGNVATITLNPSTCMGSPAIPAGSVTVVLDGVNPAAGPYTANEFSVTTTRDSLGHATGAGIVIAGSTAADGTGTIGVTPTTATSSSTGNTLIFTYAAATGGTNSGEVDIAVPSGWTAPINSNGVGCTTELGGAASLFFVGQTIEVTGLTLAGGATATITYGATSGGLCGPSDGVTAGTTSPATFTTTEKSSSAGTLTPITSPDVTLTPAAPAPTITSISPAAGPQAGATEAHTIVGTGFLTTTGVTIGGNPATYTVTDDTHIAITAIPSNVSAGVVTTVVTNSSGPSTTGTNDFTYAAPAPAASPQVTPVLAINVSPASPVTGQAVTYSFTVSGTSTTPTGTVAVFDGGAVISACGANGTLTLSNDTASCTLVYASASSHTITATYAGNVASSLSLPSTSVNVSPALTATSLSFSPTSTMSGTSVTFTATVTVTAPGAGTPTKSVAFMAGSTTICSGTINSGGVASCAATINSTGNQAITAVYGGDANFAGSTSSTGNLVVASSVTSVTPPIPTHLEFSTQPNGGTSLVAWKIRPVVAVEDASGKIVTSDTHSVKLTVTRGTGALAGCIGSVAFSSGIATFSGCKIVGAGTFTLTATDPGDAFKTTSVPFVIKASTPTITSSLSTGFVAGSKGTFTVTTTGSPAPKLSVSHTTFPSYLQFKDLTDGTAVISGTPPVGAAKTYTFTISAANSAKTVTQNFSLSFGTAPMFTSDASATFVEGQTSARTISATASSKITLKEKGDLPLGVTFQAATGVLSGTPAAGTAGVYSLSIAATNAISTVVQNFSLTINGAPQLADAAHATVMVGTAVTVMVKPGGFPTPTISSSPQPPAGVTLKDNGDGTATLSGTPTGSGGQFIFTITAKNSFGIATQSFALTVTSLPKFTSDASITTFGAGPKSLAIAPLSFAVKTSGYPAPTIVISTGDQLPSGVTLVDHHDGTATLQGTPAADSGGKHVIKFTATSSVGAMSQTFTLTVPPINLYSLSSSGLCVGDGTTTLLYCPVSGIPNFSMNFVCNVQKCSGPLLAGSYCPPSSLDSTTLTAGTAAEIKCAVVPSVGSNTDQVGIKLKLGGDSETGPTVTSRATAAAPILPPVITSLDSSTCFGKTTVASVIVGITACPAKGSSILINGKNFFYSSTVTPGLCSNLYYVTFFQLLCQLAPQAPGTVINVQVSTPGMGQTSPTGFSVGTITVPSITSLQDAACSGSQIGFSLNGCPSIGGSILVIKTNGTATPTATLTSGLCSNLLWIDVNTMHCTISSGIAPGTTIDVKISTQSGVSTGNATISF